MPEAAAHTPAVPPPAEREVLRGLAGRVAELAALPEQDEKRGRWYRHNALEPGRPLVSCDPENGWFEIVPPASLACGTEPARTWEWRLRRELFWGAEMRDDRVVEACFHVPYVGGMGTWGMQERRISGEHGGAFTWEAPLKSYDDLERLHYPDVEVDLEATHRQAELAESVFGDLLDVRLRGQWWWSLGLTNIAIALRGLERFMLDVCLEPEGLRRFMAFLRDGVLAWLEALETRGLLTSNAGGVEVGSGGYGYAFELAQNPSCPARMQDMWGFCESQETTSVSPEQFEAFAFNYQFPILERFGLNCYGCCEPLHGRWHIVRRAPRLRRVSVSPWADRAVMAEQLGDRYIYSMKPHPAVLADPMLDEAHVRKALREDLDKARGCRVEIIMKDTHTIGRNPQNVVRWTRIALEEAERAYSAG